MRRHRRIAALVVVVALACSGCWEEFILLFAIAADQAERQEMVSDLAALDRYRSADDQIDRALESDDPDERLRLVDEAAAERPDDPVPLVYRAGMKKSGGDDDGAYDDLSDARDAHHASCTRPPEICQREWAETVLEGFAEILDTGPDGPGTDQLRSDYCTGVLDYRNSYDDPDSREFGNYHATRCQ